MANRSVYVELKLQTDRYKAEAEAAARATEGLDRKVSDTDRDLKKIPRSAAEAAAAMKLLGAEGDAARLKMEDGFGRSSTSLEMLDQKLVAARAEVRRLADEFNRTGDSGILTKLFKADDAAKELENLKTRFTSMLGQAGTDGGQELTKNLSASVQGAESTPILGPAIAAAIIGGVILALPMINGLLLSAAGLGGIGLGIVGQLHDPRVQAAFAGLGHGLMSELAKDTASFVGPLQDAAGILGKDLRGALGSIDFKTLAGDVAPLAAGLGGLVRDIMPGFNTALKAAQPLLNELAADLPAVGSAISDMFDQMSKGQTGALEGLRTLLALVIGAIETIGVLVRVFSDLYDFAVKSADGLALIAKWLEEISGSPAFHIFAKIAGGLDDLTGRTPQITMVGKAFHQVGDEAQIAAQKVGVFAGGMADVASLSQRAAAEAQNLFSQLMAVDQGTLSWNTSLTQLHDTLAKNGRTLNEHTKAGQENVGSILSAVSANMQLYQAQVQSGIASADAAKQYDANEQALERQLRAQGLSQGAIDGLIGKYRGIPDAAQSAAQSMQHMADAINNLNDTLRTLFNLPSNKNITVNIKTIVSGVGSNAIGSAITAALPHKAAGGRAVGGRAYIVGEHRPEMFVPDTDGMIVPSVPRGVDYAGMRSAPGGRGWSGPTTLQLAATFVLPSGEVAHKQLITYALNTGRTPAQLFPSASR